LNALEVCICICIVRLATSEFKCFDVPFQEPFQGIYGLKVSVLL
jgi:hypothetical protein